MAGFRFCELCREWFDPTLGRLIDGRFLCAGCEAYLHETENSDHPLNSWAIDRAIEAREGTE